MSPRRRRKKRTYAEQCLEEAEPTEQPRCAYFGECGGCAWQTVAYDRQLEFKRAWIEKQLAECGFDAVEIPLPAPSPDIYGYRNKMEFSFAAWRWLTRAEIASGEEYDRGFALGMHAAGAYDRVIDIQPCPLQTDEANRLLDATRAFARSSGEEPYSVRRQDGFFRYLSLRVGVQTGQTAVVLTTTERNEPLMRRYVQFLAENGMEPHVVANGVTNRLGSSSEGAEIYIDGGAPTFQERLGPFIFDLAPDSFFQPNTMAAEMLCGVTAECAGLTGDETALDLYCGVGALSLFLAQKAERVIGIEKAASAAKLAYRNAQQNSFENAFFLEADLDKGLPNLPIGRPEVVVADPPRAGIHPKAIRGILELKPLRIVYVSCNAKAQAQDMARLCASGRYQLVKTHPIDMFPQTPHVENVAVLERR